MPIFRPLPLVPYYHPAYIPLVPGPTTATLTGPTSGALGSPSTSFTVTLDRPAGAGGVTVNVTSTVATDTFT